MEKWKLFFDSSGSDIWTVIDRAITIAAMEHPAGMRQRRDKFTEKMFCPTAHIAGLCDCDEDDDQQDEADVDEEDVSADEESDASQSRAAERMKQQQDQMKKKQEGGGDRSQRQEQESRQMREIQTLKARISNEDERDEYLCVDLEALERMQIPFELLKATGIGKAVNNLRKHPSASVRAIVKRLIRGWRDVADEWNKNADHGVTPGSPDANDDGYGLPSPPLDEDDLLAAGAAPLELFHNLIEDDLSTGSGDLRDVERENSPGDWVNGIYEDPEEAESSKPSTKPARKPPPPPPPPLPEKVKSRKDNVESTGNNNSRGRAIANNNHTNNKMSTSSNKLVNGHEPAKSLAGASRARLPTTTSSAPQRPKATLSNNSTLRKPVAKSTVGKGNNVEDEPDKLAAAKRKLHEGYQQAENAKKQRTVQVMELTELPKGKGGPRAAVKAKPQHNHRYTSHARR